MMRPFAITCTHCGRVREWDALKPGRTLTEEPRGIRTEVRFCDCTPSRPASYQKTFCVRCGAELPDGEPHECAATASTARAS